MLNQLLILIETTTSKTSTKSLHLKVFWYQKSKIRNFFLRKGKLINGIPLDQIKVQSLSFDFLDSWILKKFLISLMIIFIYYFYLNNLMISAHSFYSFSFFSSHSSLIHSQSSWFCRFIKWMESKLKSSWSSSSSWMVPVQHPSEDVPNELLLHMRFPLSLPLLSSI